MFLVLILVLKFPQKSKISANIRNRTKNPVERTSKMKYITAKEASEKWGVSERMVRLYCHQDRIPDVYFDLETWYIPADAEKPVRKKKEAPQPPKLLQTLLKQRDSKYYRGLYEYLQINMAYSSSRMASNRLTRNQIEVLYKTDHIVTNGEPVKVNDIIEARNHFLCVDLILTNAMKPLTSSLIHQLQSLLLSDNCRHKRKTPIVLGYRKSSASPKYRMTTPPKEIPSAIKKLFSEHEAHRDIGFYDILDLHVQFERIRPFEDRNGRIGRLLMLKECLRNEVIPFILDDKRRSAYLEGIRKWDEECNILVNVCTEAQDRFRAQLALQELLKYQARHTKSC